MKQNNQFMILPSYYDAVKGLPVEKQNEFLAAIVRYGVAGIKPEFDDEILKMLFVLVRPNVDNSVQYCNRERKGGAPVGNQNAAKPKKKTTPKTTDKNNYPKQPKIKGESEWDSESENGFTNVKPNARARILTLHVAGAGKSDSPPKLTKPKPRPFSRYASLADITESEITTIARDYQTTPAFVRDRLDDLKNYCGSSGRKYKNYQMALRNFVKRDLNRGARNASQLATPALFAKARDNPDLARQARLAGQPRAPASEEEIEKLRAQMPEFIRNKIAVNEVKNKNERET